MQEIAASKIQKAWREYSIPFYNKLCRCITCTADREWKKDLKNNFEPCDCEECHAEVFNPEYIGGVPLCKACAWDVRMCDVTFYCRRCNSAKEITMAIALGDSREIGRIICTNCAIEQGSKPCNCGDWLCDGNCGVLKCGCIDMCRRNCGGRKEE